jgi:phosphate-selective porin
VRPELRGELPNKFAWRMQADLAGSTAKLVDGSMEYRGWDWGTPKVGQFKEWFGGEAMYSSRYLDFLERSMMSTAFAPLEDVGAGVSGTVLGKKLFYGVGLFNGRGRNIEDNQNDKDVAGRIQFTPWAGEESPWVSGFSVGASATHGEQDELLKGVEYRSAGRVPFLRYDDGAESDGNRDRWGADVEWFVGPASIKAEYMEIQQDMIFAGSTNIDASFDGWAVTLTYLLTGEEKPRNRPLRDVGLGQGSTGAWELALRVEEFNAESGLLESGLARGTDSARAYTAGLNWYPNANIRLMLNGVHVDYDDDITVDGETTDDEDVAMLRCQYSL